MKKNSIKTIALLSTCLLLGATSIVANGNTDLSMLFALESANDASTIWGHFAGEPGTFNTPGVREYWISCSNQEIVYTKPSVGTILERNPNDYPGLYEEIKQNEDDPRYNPPLKRYMDFENNLETYPFFDLSKSTNIKSATIEEGVGYNGSKCLVIQANNAASDRGLFFKKSYLDLVFQDESIKALEFDAKGDSASSNFRHKASSGNICYQNNSNGWGLTTQWQTFSFTREMYDDIKTNGGFVIWGTMPGNLYVDNIRPVSKDQKQDNIVTKKYQTMDGLGQITGSGSSTDVFIYNAFSDVQELKVWSSVAGYTVDYSTTVKSEGSRSLHIHKLAGSQLCFGITDRIIDSLDDKGVTFDILTTSYVGPANFKKYINRTSSETDGDYILDANNWVTVTVAKENIRDCTYDYVFSMHGSDGDKEMDIYIDNIRPATAEDQNLVINFNDVGMFTYDTSYREFTNNFKFNDVANPINKGKNLRDNNLASFWLNNPNGAGDVYLDGKYVSEGTQSLKFDIVDGSKGIYLFFNKNINNSLNVGDSISFDVYSECAGNIQLGQAVTAGRESGKIVEPNKWTTITLVKSDVKPDQFFRLHEGGVGSTGSFWIDNIRISRVTKGALEFDKGSVSVNGTNFDYYYNSDFREFRASGSCITDMSLVRGKVGFRNGDFLKVTKTNNYAAFFLTKEFYSAIGADGFSFDLYSTVGVNSTTTVNNFVDGCNKIIAGGNYQHPANTWVTYTFSKDMIGSDGRFLIIQGSSAGDFYFDNIKILGSSVTYSDVGTFYINSYSSGFTIETNRNLSKVQYLKLDNQVLSSNYYTIKGSQIILTRIVAGEHKLSYKIVNADYKEDVDNYYFAVYPAGSSTDRSYTLSYGSSAYQTIENIPDARRVVFGGRSIAFEQSGNDILIPDAALVECLQTVNGSKTSGTFKLFIISGEKNANIKLANITVTLSGSAVVKEGYTKRTDKTYGTFGYSSTSGGNNEAELWDEDHFMEYKRSGLERVYEQTYAIPAKLPSDYFTRPNAMNPIQKDIARCEELGMNLIICDSFIERMAQEQSSIIGREFTIKNTDIVVNFADTDALDAALYERLQLYTTSPCINKLVLCDEPRYYNLTAVGELYKSVQRCLQKLNRSDININVNLLPYTAGYGDDGIGPQKSGATAKAKLYNTYINYLNVYLNNTGAGAITYDIYPLSSKGVLEKSYTNLVVASQYAKEHNIELHVVTESFTNCTYDGGKNDRVMSRDDMHYLLNMLMGFGVTEISFFTYYNRHHQAYDFHEQGSMVTEIYDENDKLVGTEKTDVWYNIQTTNEEMKEFDEVALNFKYEACYMYKSTSVSSALDPNGYNKDAYNYVSSFDDSVSDLGDIKKVSVSKEYTMFTSLVDSDGQHMYMIENCTDPQFNYVQTVTVTFNSGSYAAVYENGAVRYVNLLDKALTLQLSSGNAAFVIVF